MIQKTTRKRIPKIIPGMIRKVLNKRNRKLLILAVIGTVSVQAVVTTAAAARSFADKGEVNGDQIVDYSDVELLELYLIHQLDLDEKAIKNADVNSDGQITVTDLTLLVQKLEKKLDYTVSLTDPGQDTYYPNKGDEVSLKVYADVSYDGVIEKAIIDGKEYEVTRENSGLYMIKVKAGNTAGVKAYKITEVILSNGTKVPAELSVKYDILKDAPSIEQYTAEPKKDETAMVISLKLKDEDKSITNAVASITNEAGEEIRREQLKAGENKFEVPVEEGKKYNVHFTVEYNLDSSPQM